MSLRNKICSAFLVSILVTFASLIYMVQYQIKPLNMLQAQGQISQLTVSKSREIGSWLNQRISEMRIINEYPPCKNLDFEQLKPYLTNLNAVLNESYGNIGETFAIGGRDGKGWVNDNITIDVSKREYFNRAMNGDSEYVISKPVLSKSDSQPIFLICYPIKNADGEKIGFINGAVNRSLMSEIAAEFSVYGGTSWVMNRSGKAYTTGEEVLGFKGNPQALSTLGALATDSFGFVDMHSITGADSTTFYSCVPHAEDWVLCTMIDNGAINATANKIINLLLGLCGALIVITVSFALLISRSITRPIKQLEHNMLEVSNGNLDALYPSKGRDEISVLGRVFNQMLTSMKELMAKVIKVEGQKRQAELRALEAQINPHFLYNTLDTIQWKALSCKAYEAADMIQLLSKFFRISLSGGKEFITVEDEGAQITAYLQIQQIRYKDKLSYTINIAPSALQQLVPKLILQPIVENSIYHGIKPSEKQGQISISIALEKDFLCLSVEDSGVGMDEQTVKEILGISAPPADGSHYGLFNVKERLNLVYGDRYAINIESALGVGTKTTIKIPT
ncbi:MAG: sensor histidine kinase [Oscillospiraceae bacterium]